MTEMTSRSASQILGVSPREVRRLAADSRIQGARFIGRTLVLDAAEVHRLARQRWRPGRPWSERVAWAGLYLLSGSDTQWLTSAERTRLMHRLRRTTADDLEYLASNRARVRRFRSRESVLNRIEPHIVRTGSSALDETRRGLLGLTEAQPRLDGYLPMSELQVVQHEFGVVEDPSGNVTLRGVTFEDALAQGAAPRAAVFLDLAESLDTRERTAGMRETEALIAQVGRASDKRP